MVRLSFPNVEELKRMHYEAVKSYVSETMHAKKRKCFYYKVIELAGFEAYERDYDEEGDTYDWLKHFLLADCETLVSWVEYHADKLKFDYMKRLYLNRFSKSPVDYVDKEATYNAYTLFKKMNIRVCPYCEHEFLDVVSVNHGMQTKRTVEFDHFYPKGDEDYPGLAMCFYNLIPSCKPCNQLKMTNPVAANPYNPDIENLTNLCPDIPVGINIDDLSEADCKIKINPIGSMIVNESTLALEQRYDSQTSVAYQLLKCKQDFDDDKLLELERLGIGTVSELKREIFGKPRDEARGFELHTKMKYDLIGY